MLRRHKEYREMDVQGKKKRCWPMKRWKELLKKALKMKDPAVNTVQESVKWKKVIRATSGTSCERKK